MQAPAFFAELRFYDFLYRVCLMAVARGARNEPSPGFHNHPY